MFKILRIVGITIAALVALFFITTLWIYPSLQKRREAKQQKEQRLASAPAQIPRTIYLKTTLIGGTGFVIVSGEKTEATRSDGSMASVTKEYDGKGKLLASRRRLDLVGGITADISDPSGTVTEVKTPNADEAWTLSRFLQESDCALRVGGYDNRPRILRRESILGYETVIFESTGPGSKTTSWVAPKLGCTELARVDELLNPTGFPSDKVKVEATKVQLEDPDTALFDIPATYARVSFSEKFRRDLTAAKLPAPSDYKQRFQKEDQLYERLKF